MVEATLMGQKSTVPCATVNVETCVLPVKIVEVWEMLYAMRFDKMAPQFIKSVERMTGEEAQIGSTYKQIFTDGAEWVYRMTEVSERNYTVAYEVLATEPKHTASSIQGEFRLQRVTDTDETFVSWETAFSNDVDA